MADVKTCCAAPGCGSCFDTKRGLAYHLTVAGHRPAHEKASRASALVDGFTASGARPYECTYPGCGRGYRTALGRKIHRSLMGHEPPADHVVAGDGPVSTPRHPAHRPAV